MQRKITAIIFVFTTVIPLEKKMAKNEKNPGEKSKKVLIVIYADTESLLKKIDACQKNPETSSTAKVNKLTTSGYSLFTNCSFDTNSIIVIRGNSTFFFF